MGFLNRKKIPADLDPGLLMYLCMVYLLEPVPAEILTALANRGYIKLEQGQPVIRDKTIKLFAVEELPDEKFKEFFLLYPAGFAQRKFRPVEPEGIQYEKLKDLYKDRIKTIEQHEEVMKALRREVAAKLATGEMKYMQLMKTYINQATWELWKTESKLRDSNLLDEDL